jgi:CRISP-associated protein Cas1
MKTVLNVSEPGPYLSKNKDRIKISHHGETLKITPISDITAIVLSSATSVSSSTIVTCAEHDIPIIILDRQYRPKAILFGPEMQPKVSIGSLKANQRISMLIWFSQTFIANKISNQIDLAKYHKKYIRNSDKVMMTKKSLCEIADLNISLNSDNLEELQKHIFLIEARVSRQHWKYIRTLLKTNHSFTGRVHRHPTDPFNQLLNYGYAMLKGMVLRSMLVHRIDPTIGVLHHRLSTDYPLLYDLMEPFRPLVDHAALVCIHRQQKSLQKKDGLLRKVVLRRFREAFFTMVINPRPWSRNKDSLQEMIDCFVIQFVNHVKKLSDPEKDPIDERDG